MVPSLDVRLNELLKPTVRTMSFFGIPPIWRPAWKGYSFPRIYYTSVFIILWIHFVRLLVSSILNQNVGATKLGNMYLEIGGGGSSVLNQISSVGFSLVSMSIITQFYFTSASKNHCPEVEDAFFRVMSYLELKEKAQFLQGAKRFQLLMLRFSIPIILVFFLSQSALSIMLFLNNEKDVLAYFWLSFNVTCGLLTSSTWVFSLCLFLLMCYVTRTLFKILDNGIGTNFDHRNLRLKSMELLTKQLKAHFRVAKLVEEADHFFKCYILITLLLHTPMLCFQIYQTVGVDLGMVQKVVTSCWSLGVLIYVCIILFSAADVSKVAFAPKISLYGVALLPGVHEKKNLLLSALTHFNGPPIGFTCFDLFVVTHSSILNLTSVIITYIIVITQEFNSTADVSSVVSLKNETF